MRICGFGGQGVILAGFIVGQAASVYEHKHATFIQDYGPEARGGACKADVVISDERVLYPYITQPALLVVLSQIAYDKYGAQGSEDTVLVIDEDLVIPDPAQEYRRLLSIPALRLAEELGRTAVANIVMLGFLTAATNIVSPDEIKQSILLSVPKGTEELNMKAFARGYAYAGEHLGDETVPLGAS